MKTVFPLFYLSALSALSVQAAVDVASFPVVTLEGWGVLKLPVPPGYEASCFKGENEFVFSLARPKQSPELEIYNGFTPPQTEETGEATYAEIAGKRRKGYAVTQEDGQVVYEFLLSEKSAGASYAVTLHSCPDTEQLMAALGAMRFEKTAKGGDKERASEMANAAEESSSSAETRTFRAKGSFSLVVPAGLRVVESRDGDAYLFHFLTPKGERALCIYCGYAPAVQTGGEVCRAMIAGKEVEGNCLSAASEPSVAVLPTAPGVAPLKGEEYVLPGGAEGALYHITVYETPYRAQVLSMVGGMQMSGGSPLPESAREQSARLRQSAEVCVRHANMILSRVKDHATAEAAVAELRPLADTMQANDRAAAALQKRYGRALHAYLHAPDKPDSELSPTTKSAKDEPENEIQRVHEADCYGSAALENLLMRFMGIEND